MSAERPTSNASVATSREGGAVSLPNRVKLFRLGGGGSKPGAQGGFRSHHYPGAEMILRCALALSAMPAGVALVPELDRLYVAACAGPLLQLQRFDYDLSARALRGIR